MTRPDPAAGTPAGPAQRGPRHGFNGIFDALWAQARSQKITNPPEKADFEAELADAVTSATPQGVVAPAHPDAGAELAVRSRHGCGRTPTESCRGRDRDPAGSFTDADDRRRGPAHELDDGWAGRSSWPARTETRSTCGTGSRRSARTRTAAARAQQVQRDDDHRDYAHVVDEAQDVSPMQWRMIGRRASTPPGRWSAIRPTAWSRTPRNWTAPATARSAPSGTYSLTTNHRNSSEISRWPRR
jgi:hypothetical protein